MSCGIHKIDSNITGLAFAEEECLKQLPSNVTWYNLEPNSYSDFGGTLETVARAPIDPSRQNKKGTVTDLDASGGFSSDFTQSNLTRLLQGFFFADARELPTSKPLNSAQAAIAASGNDYALADADRFKAGQILLASGFSVAANNGLKTVGTATSTDVTVVEALATEAAGNGVLQAVGFQFAEDDAELTKVGKVVSLETTLAEFDGMAYLYPGVWVFLDGFATGAGFARIKSVAKNKIVFDDLTWAAVADDGADKKIRMFIGNVIKNEKEAANIKRRSYNIERTLGMGADGVQAEYLEGAVPNEFSLSVPQAEKLTADLSFIACSNEYRSGDDGDKQKAGTRVSAPGEDAYNTSSDIYRIKMHVHDDSSSTPDALFGYVSEASINVNNNVSANKAVGVLGSFDTTAGNFEVGGSITAYFTTVSAVKAVRNNADVGLSIIGAAKNAGFIFDLPLLGLGGGRLNVEKDAPITVPLEPAGAENAHGYTLLYQWFNYLPDSAMP